MNDPFRVRRAGSSGEFSVIELTAASSAQIMTAIEFAVGPVPFILRKVAETGPPVVYGSYIVGLHDKLYGPHEVFSVLDGEGAGTGEPGGGGHC